MIDFAEKALAEIKEVATAYPRYVPVVEAAKILHMRPEALRAALEQGTCPFGFCWRLGGRAAYKIPTLTFVGWLTNSSMLKM